MPEPTYDEQEEAHALLDNHPEDKLRKSRHRKTGRLRNSSRREHSWVRIAGVDFRLFSAPDGGLGRGTNGRVKKVDRGEVPAEGSVGEVLKIARGSGIPRIEMECLADLDLSLGECHIFDSDKHYVHMVNLGQDLNVWSRHNKDAPPETCFDNAIALCLYHWGMQSGRLSRTGTTWSHGDIKPGNTMIQRPGQVRAVDYGTAGKRPYGRVHAPWGTWAYRPMNLPGQLTAQDYDVFALLRTLWYPKSGFSAEGQFNNGLLHQVFTDEMVETYGLAEFLDTSGAVVFDVQSLRQRLLHPLALAAILVAKKHALVLDYSALKQDLFQCMLLVEMHKIHTPTERIPDILDNPREFMESCLPESCVGASLQMLRAWFMLQQLVPSSQHGVMLPPDDLLELMDILERRNALRHLSVFLKTPRLREALTTMHESPGLFSAILNVLDEFPDVPLRAERIEELLQNPGSATASDTLTEYARFICRSKKIAPERQQIIFSCRDATRLFVRTFDTDADRYFLQLWQGDFQPLRALLLQDDVPSEAFMLTARVLSVLKRKPVGPQYDRGMALLQEDPGFLLLCVRRQVHDIIAMHLCFLDEMEIQVLKALDNVLENHRVYKALCEWVIKNEDTGRALDRLLKPDFADFSAVARCLAVEKTTARALALWALDGDITPEGVRLVFDGLYQHWDDDDIHDAIHVLLQERCMTVANFERITDDDALRELLPVIFRKQIHMDMNLLLSNPAVSELLLVLLEAFPVSMGSSWPPVLLRVGAEYLSRNRGEMPKHPGFYPAMHSLIGNGTASPYLFSKVFESPEWCSLAHVITSEPQRQRCDYLLERLMRLGEEQRCFVEAILDAASAQAGVFPASGRFAAFSEEAKKWMAIAEERHAGDPALQDILLDMHSVLEATPAATPVNSSRSSIWRSVPSGQPRGENGRCCWFLP